MAPCGGRSQLGALASFGNGCYASCPTMSEHRPAAPSTPSWTAMGWLLGKGALAQKPKVPLYPKDSLRMLCGAPTIRASSCSGTKDIATPLPSRTTPAVIFCSAKPWSPSSNRGLLPLLSACSRSAACPKPFAPTTASPLLHPMASSAYVGDPFVDFASHFPPSMSHFALLT